MQSISSQQCQCARVLLDWDQADLATRCGLHVQTICLFETGKNTPSKRTLEKITSVLMNAGIEFTDGNGVRKRQVFITNYQAMEGFQTFMDDVYSTVKEEGGEICVFNVDEKNWIKWMGIENYERHAKRMKGIKKPYNFKIIVEENDWYFIAHELAEYRWFPKTLFDKQSFYSYGNKLAFINFEINDVQVLVLQQPAFSKGFRVLFNIAWQYVAKRPKSKRKTPTHRAGVL